MNGAAIPFQHGNSAGKELAHETDPGGSASPMTRWQSYAWVVLILIAPYVVLNGSPWIGDKQLHTLMEVIATITALFVGAIAYLRFRTNQRQFVLLVAAGFVGTALLDGYHAVVTSTWLDSIWQSPPEELIPWSWNISRTYLAIVLAVSVRTCRRGNVFGRSKAISENAVFAMVASLCLLTIALFTLIPLPRAYYPELLIGRPEEFVAALLFTYAFIGLYRDGRWRTHSFEHWLMVSILVACICQAVYMSRSFELFDAMFDAAHVLKLMSYIAVLVGLFVSSYKLYQDNAKVTSELQQMAGGLEHAAEAIAILDRDCSYRYVNPAYERQRGVRAVEVLGKKPWELSHRRDEGSAYRDMWMSVLDGIAYSGRRTINTADGRCLVEDTTISPVKDASGSVKNLVAVIRDVTEQIQLEQQLVQSQKLESIGQLAAGIAHEINTPTQFVGDNMRFVKDAFADFGALLDKLTELQASAEGTVCAQALGEALEQADVGYLREEIPRALAQSLEGVERVAKIVRAMKEFSHPAQEKTLLDLNSAIQSTLTVACNEWKYVAEVQTEFDATLPQVPCLPGEFNQVILNMVVNAAHAIADKLGESPSTKGVISVATSQVGDFVEISVSDTGCGMPEAVKARIFDPFFTTKEVGKGTGQGLNIAHDVVVNKHQGEIRVDSEPGKGTCLTIRLPLKSQATVAPVAAG